MADEIKSLDQLKDAVAEAEKEKAAAAEAAAAPPEPEAVVVPVEAPVEAPEVEAEEVILREPVRDAHGRSYATGKRKDAVARVWVRPGGGKVVVNGKEMNAYFARPVLQMVIGQPFKVANVDGQFDVNCTVKGGGLSGQAGAVKHGISKALSLFDPGLRASLKAAGFLTRDSRVVERKKYGRRKARRSFQFSKR